LFPFLFPHSHYGYVLSGEPNSVKAFTPDDAKRFWEKQRKAPWTLTVCGTFDRKAVLEMARKLAATPAEPAPDFTAPVFTDKRELPLTLKGREQSHLYWILPVPGALSPDTPALQALNTVLTGQGGILFRTLRDEQGLGYSVGSQLWQTPKTGLLVFSIATKPGQTAQALDGFKQAAAQVAVNGITTEQLDRAKSSLTGDYYQGRQSLDSRAESCAANLAMGYPMDFDKQTLDKVQALTTAQVAEIAKKYLDGSKAYLVRVDP
jgi:zinc protease